MSNIKWKNSDPIEVFENLKKDWGNPNVICEDEGGLAIWFKDNLDKINFFGEKNCYHEIVLRDEAVKHLCPGEHYDYLYAYVKLDIPPNKLLNVLSLSGSVGYDPLKKLLYARCAGMGANLVTLKLATDIILDHTMTYTLDNKTVTYTGIKDIQKQGLYGFFIKTDFTPEFRRQFYKDLCENIKKINKLYNFPEGYWIDAFSYKNGKCLPPN